MNHTNHFPQSIFILVSPTTFSSKSDNYVAYPIHRYLESPLSNLDIIIKYQHLNQLFSIYRKSFKKGLSNIFQLLTNNLSQANITEDIDRGFISSNISVTKEIINKSKDQYQPLRNDKFDFKNISRLEKITQTLKSKDIEVIFFELPTNKLNDYFNTQYISDYEKTLKNLSNKNQLLRVDRMLFNNNHFRNIDHLNNSGAKIATKELIKFLINNKL